MTTREFIAQGKYIISQDDPLSKNCAFLVHGCVAVGTAMPVARRSFPRPETTVPATVP